MSKNKVLIEDQKYNLRLFPIYKMFSWDLLFYYSISFLFLTQAKELTPSLVLLGDSFYPIFIMVFQLPSILLSDKIGNKHAVVVANLLVAFSILILMIGDGLPALIISNLVMAIGYAIKGNCEVSMINECIPKGKKKNSLFSKIDGKGSANWYYLDAISATITGFLYVFNPYLPMCICFALLIISSYLASRFCITNTKSDITKEEDKKEISFIQASKTYMKDLKTAFQFIFQSNRLKSLLLFSGLFYALTCIASTLNSSLLKDMNIPEQYFGIIFAVLGITSGIMATKQDKIQKKYKNRTLTFFSIPYSISFIILGTVIIFHLNYVIGLLIIFCMLGLQYAIKGPYWTSIKRYLNSFTTPTLITKIYSAYNLINGTFRFVLTLLCSYLMSITTTSYCFLIIGIINIASFFLLLKYMKTRVGLKPEQYRKKDIKFVELK